MKTSDLPGTPAQSRTPFTGRKRIVRGLRVLYYDGVLLYATRGLSVFTSGDLGQTWRAEARVRLPVPLRFAARARLAERLGRLEVYKLHRAAGNLAALSRGGVFCGPAGGGSLECTLPAGKGSRPVAMAVAPDGTIVVGEYHSNLRRESIKIFKSRDGITWDVAWEFEPGEIRHVHGIYWDEYRHCFWVATGDDGMEPGIARADEGFTTLEFVCRGEQETRAYSLVIRPDSLWFGTDSDRIRNAVYALDPSSGARRRLQDVQASVFHSGQFAGWACFATVCEPSICNDTENSHIWASREGSQWIEIACHPRDRVPVQFQYGNVFFPEGHTNELPMIIYSCTALRGLDNAAVFLTLDDRGTAA